MRRILLLSDTHDHLDEGVFRYGEDCDEIWHAGDIGSPELALRLSAFRTLRAVYGNIDGDTVRDSYPENNFFICEKVRVLMTHIGGYPGRYPSRIKQLLLQHHPKLFICGHSHILKVMYDKQYQLLHLNPGACGNQGFHQVKTMLRFDIDQEEIKNLSVIELGKRSSVT